MDDLNATHSEQLEQDQAEQKQGESDKQQDQTALQQDEQQAQEDEQQVQEDEQQAQEDDQQAEEDGQQDKQHEQGEKQEEQSEENAQKHFEAGCVALKGDDYDAAVDCLSKALEIRVTLYGELAPECATTYFKYGCALLYKVQGERDALIEPAKLKEKGVKIVEGKQDAERKIDDESNENAEEGAEEEDIGEDEETDLELAWKLMDIARVIYEKQRSHSLEEVDVVIGLADISLEKEDFQTCMEDYNKALEILRGLVASDSRRLAELYFKISLAQQLERKPKEALESCQKAISVCETRLSKVIDSSSEDSTSEIKELESLLADLKEKADELREMASVPPLFEALAAENPVVAETVKQAFMAAYKQAENASNSSEGTSSSQPDAVTHLGVVGRGVKRTAPIPENSEADAQKRPQIVDEAKTE